MEEADAVMELPVLVFWGVFFGPSLVGEGEHAGDESDVIGCPEVLNE